MSKEVLERVTNILVEQLNVKPSEVTPHAHFINDLGADSLDTFELISKFEDVFDLNISDEDAEQINTVQQAVDYISARAD